VATTIDADQLVATARDRSGLEDLGSDTYRVGLDLLLEGLDSEGALSELGAAITPDILVGYLTNRMEIVDWHRQHPELGASDLGSMVFMIGMGRTGTTILQDLLAQDPVARAPRTWEVDRPVPPPEDATYETDPRIAEIEAQMDLAHQARPEMQAMHPTGATLAQECVRITGGEFASVIFGSQFRVPGYLRWVTKDADMAPTYRYHKQFLQVIGAKYRGERWVLKSGAHLWALRALLGEYPDAHFIQTHRDPVKIVASLSSLFAYLGAIFSDEVTITDTARTWADLILDGLDRSVDARENGSIAPDRVVDVQFEAFMADHFGTIRGIYDQWGVELTPDVEGRMRAFLDDHGREKHGKHLYAFADTGLDEGEIRERAKRYTDYFDVPVEEMRP
jgi:hypothetical protein